MPANSPIHRITQLAIRSTDKMPTQQRIATLRDAVEVLPDGADTVELQRLIAVLTAADAACREFSFIRESEQI